MEIKPLLPEHWPSVKSIYLEGIQTKQATFETEVPEWDSWNQNHHAFCRFVALEEGIVEGWVAISPVSKRAVYQGVAEVSIYIGKNVRGKGIGKKLFRHMIEESEKEGIWTLQSSLYPENIPSVNLHYQMGFREVGIRKRVARQYGVWRDTLIMERRSKLEKFQ